MPYTTVYRGLASAIGLLLWMLFTAIIVLIGAAYNAEYRESHALAPGIAPVAAPVVIADAESAYGVTTKSADIQ